MSDPIDIKTKKTLSQTFSQRFDKSLLLDALERNIISNWDSWGKLQQSWTNNAYNTFKDLDKYIVLIYLVRDYWQQLANKFQYFSMSEFYSKETVVIDKINLITISTELNIPKETVRRKVNELQKQGILKREGKKIVLTRNAYTFQRPEKSLETLSIFLEKKSKILDVEDWFGEKVSRQEIKAYIEKYFTIIWLRFLKLQIPFLLRHRKNFRDLESWMVWGNVALHHQKSLATQHDKLVTISANQPIDLNNYYDHVSDLRVERGVNASSIADITHIPRATVIRKLKWLVKQNVLKKNKYLEYLMSNKGKLNKKIGDTFKINQVFVAEFIADFFDYYKNSNFKPDDLQ